MKNENDRKKIREPYEPKDTPKPPQIIDPNEKKRENPVEKAPSKNSSPENERDSKSHLLGDETEIDDETTI